MKKRQLSFLRTKLRKDENLLEKEKKKTNPDSIFLEYLENNISFCKREIKRIEEINE